MSSTDRAKRTTFARKLEPASSKLGLTLVFGVKEGRQHTNLRISSLLSAAEILFVLGLADSVMRLRSEVAKK
jgi:hypothetical protein